MDTKGSCCNYVEGLWVIVDCYYHEHHADHPKLRLAEAMAMAVRLGQKGIPRDVTFSFVHAADLHLDSPFTGIRASTPHVGTILQRATFDAYDHVIELCLDRGVNALLVAGL
jgi:hypothetical protein